MSSYLKYALLGLSLFIASPLAALDTCQSAQYGLCTLPCGTITTSPTQVLNVNANRTELLVVNTSSTYIFVILGRGLVGYDYTYGIPVAPTGQSGSVLDLQIQPDPSKKLHTWQSAVSIATQTGTGTCVYGEQAQ